MFIEKFERYGVSKERKYETKEEALDSAAMQIEFNTAYPIEIVDEDTGEVVYTHKQIADYGNEKYNRLYEEEKKERLKCRNSLK